MKVSQRVPRQLQRTKCAAAPTNLCQAMISGTTVMSMLSPSSPAALGVLAMPLSKKRGTSVRATTRVYVQWTKCKEAAQQVLVVHMISISFGLVKRVQHHNY